MPSESCQTKQGLHSCVAFVVWQCCVTVYRLDAGPGLLCMVRSLCVVGWGWHTQQGLAGMQLTASQARSSVRPAWTMLL